MWSNKLNESLDTYHANKERFGNVQVSSPGEEQGVRAEHHSEKPQDRGLRGAPVNRE